MKMMRMFARGHTHRCLACIMACYMLFINVPLRLARATPGGAEIVAGSASVGQSNNTTNVQMLSDRAVINWQSLDTAQNEVLNFMKSSDFAVLNRVVAGGATQFDGSLFAENGSVFIVNTQGLVFGPTAYIQASQFVGSSLDMRTDDFMNGRYSFGGGNGAVVNYGDIVADKAALIGKQVLNAGSIVCPQGVVIMAAGDRVFLGEDHSNVFVEVDSLPSAESQLADVTNQGSIEADNGKIILAAGDSFSRAISNIGTLAASSGTVTLDAAKVEQSGTISADAVEGDAGSIDLTAAEQVTLGAGSLTTANAGNNGNGGEVIIQSQGSAIVSDSARIEAKGGTESGDGGFIEVSGEHFVFAGEVDASAANGEAGTFVIDPVSMTIADGAAPATPAADTMYEEDIEAMSQGGTNVLVAADDSVTVEDIRDDEITGGTGGIELRAIESTGSVTFVDKDEHGMRFPSRDFFDNLNIACSFEFAHMCWYIAESWFCLALQKEKEKVWV